MIRVELPALLRRLARVDGVAVVDVDGAPTQGAVLDALEEQHPVLRGTIRDVRTGKRRPFIRVFACGKDLSHTGSDEALPDAVAQGVEPLMIVGAMAGG